MLAAVAIVYGPADTYDCATCTQGRALGRLCTKPFAREGAKPPERLTREWPKPRTKEWNQDACLQLLATHAEFDLVDEARQYTKHGIMPVAGGLWDQPLWWSVAIGLVRGEIASLEAPLLTDKARSQILSRLEHRRLNLYEDST